MSTANKTIPPLELAEGPFRTCTASAKLTESEFAAVETLAKSSGKRLGEWVREVLLKELNKQEPITVTLAEILGLRMIVLNLLEPLLRGQQLSVEEFQALLAKIDQLKMRRAQEQIAGRAAQEGA